ncbi:MAG: hypothetical protein V3V47_00210 [Desulfobacteria bacterium]|jgi:hypothetical protein
MGYVQAFIVFVCGEIVGLLLFPTLTHYLGPQNASAWDNKAILKGVLERLVLFTGLLHDYPQILIAFAAMKLGTRLHHEEGGEISNTYFLVGNLLSIFIAIVAVIVTKRIWAL